MIDLVSMIGRTPEDLGIFQELPANLAPLAKHQAAQASADSVELSSSFKEGQSLTVEILVVQVSMHVSSRAGAANPVQQAYSPLDFSPEATAHRIFQFSMGMYGVYQAQHSDEPSDVTLANFEELVRGAIDEGFGDALEMLEQLGRLDETTNEFVNNTRSILERLLDAFFNPEKGDPSGGSLSSDNPAEVSQAFFRLEYQYFSLQASSSPEGTDGLSHLQPGTSVNVQAETLSISAAYRQGVQEPVLQIVA